MACQGSHVASVIISKAWCLSHARQSSRWTLGHPCGRSNTACHEKGVFASRRAGHPSARMAARAPSAARRLGRVAPSGAARALMASRSSGNAETIMGKHWAREPRYARGARPNWERRPYPPLRTGSYTWRMGAVAAAPGWARGPGRGLARSRTGMPVSRAKVAPTAESNSAAAGIASGGGVTRKW